MANDIIPSTDVIILLDYLLWRDFYTDANLKQHSKFQKYWEFNETTTDVKY